MPITFFVAFLVSLMVGATLTLVVRHLAHRWELLDQARSSRKVHTQPIPRLGGIAIVGGFFAPLVALFFVDSSVGNRFASTPDLAQGLFSGGLVIAALGLYDDLRGTGAPLKFAVQFGVALALYELGFRIDVLANPFGPQFELGYLSLPFTVLWMVGVVNAMNLIDGLDGLAGGVAFIGVATNFVLALVRGDILLTLFMAALAGAILGFLIFNFNPASIFMGDTGSMFLGFVLAAVSIKTSTKSGTTVAMLVPIVSLGLPIMDTLLAMARRTVLGRPMFSADKEHIHHRLMSRMQLSHRDAVLALYGLACLFAASALALTFSNSAETAMLLGCLGLVVFALMRKLGYLNLKQAATVVQVRRRNLQLRSAVRGASASIRKAEGLEGVWESLRGVFESLQASSVELRVERDSEATDGARETRQFAYERPEWEQTGPETRLELKAKDDKVGELVVRWGDGRPEVNRDEELALELLADAVADRAAELQALAAAEASDPGRVVSLRARR